MNQKNRVVCNICMIFSVVMLISIVLSGCFPWPDKEQSVDIKQQSIREEKKTEKIATKPVPEKKTIEDIVTDGKKIIHKPIIQKIEPQKKRCFRRTRRRQRKKENNRKKISTQNITTIATPVVVQEILPIKDDTSTVAVVMPDTQKQKPISIDDNPPQDTVIAPHTIDIQNAISIDELAVKHWTGTYTPTSLTITINNVPFTIIGTNVTPRGTTQQVLCPDKRLTVRYVYEFLNGMRKGSDTIEYIINSKTPRTIPMHFSWDTAWHVELEGAQRV